MTDKLAGPAWPPTRRKTFLCSVPLCGKLTRSKGSRCDFHRLPFFSRSFDPCAPCLGRGAVLQFFAGLRGRQIAVITPCDRCGGRGRVPA
jgi:hypothetical protein